MPYIHCSECRLTVYGGIAYSEKKQCPRCGMKMSQSPRPLFRSLRAGRPRAPAARPGDHLARGPG